MARCAGAAQILVCLHQIGRMEMALITVIGASGRQGMAQVKQALAAGYDVRAISRQPEPFAGAKIEGIERIEVRPMDLYDTATFKPALEGSDYIFYTHPLQARADRAVLIGDLGKVAAELDVKRVVWNTSSITTGFFSQCSGNSHFWYYSHENPATRKWLPSFESVCLFQLGVSCGFRSCD